MNADASVRLFAYAIVPAGVAAPADLRGMRGAPVDVVTSGDLGVWVTALAPFEAAREDLLTHHRVVEYACAAGPALPVRFGTVFGERDALESALRRRAPALSATLARVGMQRELALTLEWCAPTDVPSPDPAPHAGPGRRFLVERAWRLGAAERRRTRAEKLSNLLHAALAEVGAVNDAVKVRIVPSARIALSCAVLTDPSRAGELARRVRDVADGWDDVRLHLAGPWPPYSFSDTE